MKRYLLLLLMFVGLAACSGSSENEIDYSLIPVGTGNRLGYINLKGEFVINPQFQDAHYFRDGIALVKKDNQWGYIDKEGNYIINPQFMNATDFKEGLAWVVSKKGWPKAIDKKGNEVISDKSIFEVYNFSEGLALFTNNGNRNRKGFLSKSGETVIPAKYAQVFGTGFKNNTIGVLGGVEDDFKFGYINKKGEILNEDKLNPPFPGTGGYNKQGYAIAINNEKKYGIINKKGDFVVEPQFENIIPDGDMFYIQFKKYGDWGILSDGKIIINPQFKKIKSFNNQELAPVLIDDRWGYINKKGKYIITPRFLEASSFNNEGYACVVDLNGLGLINKKGEYIVNPQFTGASKEIFEQTNNKSIITNYLYKEGVCESVKNMLQADSFDGMKWPITVNTILSNYDLKDKYVPKYSQWEIKKGAMVFGATCNLLFEGFFYEEVSDGWWGKNSVLNKNATMDSQAIKIQLTGLYRKEQSLELLELLQKEIGNSFNGYKLNYKLNNSAITINVSK